MKQKTSMTKTNTSPWRLKEPLYVGKKDKRYPKFYKQLETRGFADDETWSLHTVIARFVLPRIKRLRKISIAYPAGITEEKWDAILDDIAFAFQWHLDSEKSDIPEPAKENEQNWARYHKGLKLFGEYFHHLGW